jgi:RNA polymerase sigma-70 factor (sigma-E family)
MTMKQDDETAFRGFVDARWNALVATAWLVTADRQIAEDCVQDALVGVHRHWSRVSREGNIEAYARRAAINSALSWRRRRRIAEIPVDQVPEVSAPDEPELGIDPDLVAALRSLPPRMRAVVALRFVEDRSEAETAHLLGCSAGTVKSASHKGLAKLRESLAHLGPVTVTRGPVTRGPVTRPVPAAPAILPTTEGGAR